MPIQDDIREDALIAQFQLIKYSAHSRGEYSKEQLDQLVNQYKIDYKQPNGLKGLEQWLV